MSTWFEYREVWGAHRWVLALAIAALAMIAAGIIGTLTGGLLALFFVPGLGAIFVHHLIVAKKIA